MEFRRGLGAGKLFASKSRLGSVVCWYFILAIEGTCRHQAGTRDRAIAMPRGLEITEAALKCFRSPNGFATRNGIPLIAAPEHRVEHSRNCDSARVEGVGVRDFLFMRMPKVSVGSAPRIALRDQDR